MTPPCAPRTAPARRAGAVVGCLTVLIAMAAWTVVWAPAANAHGTDDGVRYRLAEVTPAVDGLTVQVVRGLAGQLVLQNETGQRVEVLDEAGRPFLRIEPDGVSGDVASATWRASDQPFGLGDPGTADEADEEAQPTWVPLSDEPSWGWYDHRMHAAEVAAPVDASGPVVLDTWEVVLRVGGTAVTIRGETVGGPRLGHVAPRLVSEADVAEGVSVQVLPGSTPGILLSVAEGHEAIVRGEAGEPFLRFAGGQVEVNAASPTWHRVGGGQATPTVIDALAAPQWQPVAQGQRYGWIEPRAAVPSLPDAPLATGTVLSTWAVPMEVDGRTTSIVGELQWVARPGTGRDDGVAWPNVVMAAGGVAAVGALVAVRRRGALRQDRAQQ